MLWHILLHFGVRLFMEPDAPAPVKPYTGIDYLKSDIQHLKDILASGSRVRQQTPAEREANPTTTFGYERFPLTEKEREGIANQIEYLEEMLRRLKAANLK